MPLWHTFFDFYEWFLPCCYDHKGIEQGHLSLIEVGSSHVANIQGKAEGNDRMPRVVFKLYVVRISWDIPLEENQRVLWQQGGPAQKHKNLSWGQCLISYFFSLGKVQLSECRDEIVKAVSQSRGGQQDGDGSLTCWHGHRVWLAWKGSDPTEFLFRMLTHCSFSVPRK